MSESQSILDLIESIDTDKIAAEITELELQRREIDKKIDALRQVAKLADIRKNGKPTWSRKPRTDKKANASESVRPTEPPITRSPIERIIADCLQLQGPLKVAEISRQINIDYGKTYAAIKQMEKSGDVLKRQDERFVLTKTMKADA